MPRLLREAVAQAVTVAAWLVLLVASSGVVSAAPTFNRTFGEVRVSSCEGLKNKVELGLDISIVIDADLLCEATMTLGSGQEVTIASDYSLGPTEEYTIVIAEAFATPDPTAASLIVNPHGAHLTLERLKFMNEVGADGVARAVWNAGTLVIVGCTFVNLNFASKQDGGAIYSLADDPGSDVGGIVSVRNSTFMGNIAKNYGGAIAARVGGIVTLSNCTFSGNEVVGSDNSYRRSGSGGGVYASSGVLVSVLNSSFEGCLGRYGGAALFLCGGMIEDSTFDGNEATGLFGAVVNGDLSEEERQNATLLFSGTFSGQNYTCPDLAIAGTTFIGNSVISGVGGAIASVDASLSVYNSSLLESSGGALYFGTSDDSGRDQLDMDLIKFYSNEGPELSSDLVGAAFLLELTGSPASNTTVQQVEDLLSSSSSISPEVIRTASEGASTSHVVGTGRNFYCFQNDPYECEGYFGDVSIQLTGVQRCSTCEGNSFTGIGSLEGVPTPAPLGFDDDDGLSQMGQERAQGGTLSPITPGASGSSSGSDSSRNNSGGNTIGDDSGSELLGVTGSMRYVVLGLIAGIAGSLLICMCLLIACRVSKNKRKRVTHENAQEAGMKSLRSAPPPLDDSEEGLSARNVSRASGGGVPHSTVRSENYLFAESPESSGVLVHPGSSTKSMSRRGSRTPSDVTTPSSQRKARQVARQRVLDMSAEADRLAEEVFRATRPPPDDSNAIPSSPRPEKVPKLKPLPGTLPKTSSMKTEDNDLNFDRGSTEQMREASGGTARGEQHGGRKKLSRGRSRGLSRNRSRERCVGSSEELTVLARESSNNRSMHGANVSATTPPSSGGSIAVSNSHGRAPRRSSELPEYEWVSDALNRKSLDMETSSSSNRARSIGTRSVKNAAKRRDREDSSDVDSVGMKSYPSFRSKGSAKVYSKTFFSSRSELSEEGSGDWSRNTPGRKDRRV